jgi:hypothetical protein
VSWSERACLAASSLSTPTATVKRSLDVHRHPELDVDPGIGQLPGRGGGLPGLVLHPDEDDGRLAEGEPGLLQRGAGPALVAADEGDRRPVAVADCQDG